jgi:hypothetical protein
MMNKQLWAADKLKFDATLCVRVYNSYIYLTPAFMSHNNIIMFNNTDHVSL